MPIYSFQHPDTGETKDVQQRMKEDHVYLDKNGVKWNRVFTSPHTCIPLGVNPNSSDDFVARTKDLKGTSVGEMWDLSKELSDKRKHERGDGTDPVQSKYFKDYSTKRKGLKHQDDKIRDDLLGS
jgi:hypothetical protein